MDVGCRSIQQVPKGPRTQIVGFEGLNTIILLIFGP